MTRENFDVVVGNVGRGNLDEGYGYDARIETVKRTLTLDFLLADDTKFLKSSATHLAEGYFIIEKYVEIEDLETSSARAQEMRVRGEYEFIFDRTNPDVIDRAHTKESKGVVNIDSWQWYIGFLWKKYTEEGLFRDLFVTVSEAETEDSCIPVVESGWDIYKLNFKKYFKNVSYGHRLVYVYPLTSNRTRGCHIS